jgi:hypothetical protein
MGNIKKREAKFLDKVQLYFKCTRKEAKEWLTKYNQRPLYIREQQRKQLIDFWEENKKYEDKLKKQLQDGQIPEPSTIYPPETEKGLEEERVPKKKWKREKPPKFVPKSKYETSIGFLNPDYVNLRGKKNLRFVPLGGKSQHYYDLATDHEVNRREYDTIRKKEGKFLNEK